MNAGMLRPFGSRGPASGEPSPPIGPMTIVLLAAMLDRNGFLDRDRAGCGARKGEAKLSSLFAAEADKIASVPRSSRKPPTVAPVWSTHGAMAIDTAGTRKAATAQARSLPGTVPCSGCRERRIAISPDIALRYGSLHQRVEGA